MAKKKTKNFPEGDFTMTVRVLGYLEEDNQWAAHCLETDIVGYGESFEDAVENLKELTEIQISFAKYMDDPGLLRCSAPMHIIETYFTFFQDYIIDLTRGISLPENRRATSIPFLNPYRASGECFVEG